MAAIYCKHGRAALGQIEAGEWDEVVTIGGMRAEDVREFCKKQPFVPFRIHRSDGSHYDVPHPDFILITRRTLHVALPDVRRGIPDRATFCDLTHVTRLEPIAADTQNGEVAAG